MAIVINTNGYTLDFDTAVNYMDDDLREQLYRELAPCSEQDFFIAYEAAHEAAHGEAWELSKTNPTW